jgi:hypothetical protein
MHFFCKLLLFVFCSEAAFAQSDPDTSSKASPTLFPHSDTSRFWVAGQMNIITQGHPSFSALYSGENSLRTNAEHATSRLFTLYTGVELTSTTDFLFDVESAGGRGISDANGLAGFTNLDVVRNPTLGAKPYIARIMLHQTIPLSADTVDSERGPFSLATKLPARRIELRFGKFGAADFFDLNSVGSDSHLQFTNWTIDNNGAYDYAADTRGYTYGGIAEFQARDWGIRFGEMLMPEVANGIDLVWNLRRSRAENVEFELRRSLLQKKSGALRLLSYMNHANMGVYRDANNAFLQGQGRLAAPDITAHPPSTTVKYGFGINAEQEVTNELRLFARWGWNEGQHESFAYTEVDETIQFGGDYKGEQWGRKFDKLGIAFVSNGIKADHQRYLALGGRGFLLGDGRLNYDRENILESYYNIHLWRGVFTAPQIQFIWDPGYNRDRGPVVVPGARLHVDF